MGCLLSCELIWQLSSAQYPVLSFSWLDAAISPLGTEADYSVLSILSHWMPPELVGRKPLVDLMWSLSKSISLSEKRVDDPEDKEVEEGQQPLLLALCNLTSGVFPFPPFSCPPCPLPPSQSTSSLMVLCLCTGFLSLSSPTPTSSPSLTDKFLLILQGLCLMPFLSDAFLFIHSTNIY